VDIIIETNPVSQLRPRISGNRMYDPKKVRDYKKYIAWETKRQWKKEPLQGAVKIKIDIYRDIQKTESKKNKKLKDEGVIRPTVKSDLDNYLKAVLDAMNKIAYVDDSQIVEINARKFYSYNPRVEIKLDII